MLSIKLKRGDMIVVDGTAILCTGMTAKLAIHGGAKVNRVYNCTTLSEIQAACDKQLAEINGINK